jgi:hypothetical protein
MKSNIGDMVCYDWSIMNKSNYDTSHLHSWDKSSLFMTWRAIRSYKDKSENDTSHVLFSSCFSYLSGGSTKTPLFCHDFHTHQPCMKCHDIIISKKGFDCIAIFDRSGFLSGSNKSSIIHQLSDGTVSQFTPLLGTFWRCRLLFFFQIWVSSRIPLFILKSDWEFVAGGWWGGK